MTEPVKARPYNSILRQERAAQTRQRILDAAARLFVEEGYGPTSVRRIADTAQVAPDTVYAIFGTKAKVLTAVLDLRLVPSGQSVHDRPEAKAIRAERDPRRLLHRFAHDYATMSERVRPISEVLRTAKAVDPTMAAVRDESEAHRFAYVQTVVRWLARRTTLKVPAKRAAQIVWALASPDVARMLCDVQGWSTEEYANWLEEALAASLLVDEV